MQSVRIGTNQAGQRLDKFLHKYLPLAGNGFLYKMLRKKNITLNGRKAEGNEILQPGDQVCTFFSEETFAKFSGREAPKGYAEDVSPQKSGKTSASAGDVRNSGERDIHARGQKPVKALNENPAKENLVKEYEAAYKKLCGITVLYEDSDFLILDKPSGILTQKAAAGDLSLNEWMIGYLLHQNPALAEELPLFRPSVCNRLDRNTSGIVLCGKSFPGLQFFSQCVREHSVRKFYRTICVGALREAASIEGHLVKDSAQNRVIVTAGNVLAGEERQSKGRRTAKVQELQAAPRSGKASPICTVYAPIAVTDAYTLLEVELITGKSHQIRAHLASIGHPLTGDYKYGLEAVNRMLRKKYGLEHHLLHAGRVTFPEITSGPGARLSGRSIEAPCPEQFRELEEALFPTGRKGTG